MHHQKIQSLLVGFAVVLASIFLFVCIAGFIRFNFTNGGDIIPGVNAPEEPVMCTMEAKLCPDGSAVGRSGPRCEFSPCPGDVANGL